MSNNYYLRCTRRVPRFDEQTELHIGLSARGWAFALHVIPELGINSLDDWRERYHDATAEIIDEAGKIVSPHDMDDIIQVPHAREGERLSRVSVDGKRCVGNGDGPWQLFVGDFC